VLEIDEEPEALRLDLAPLPIAEQARALREALVGVRDPVEIRRGLASIAELAGVDAAFIIGEGDAGPEVASYELAANRLSLPRPAGGASGLFGLLIAAELPSSIELVAPDQKPAPWYLRPLGIASLAAVGITGVTIALVLSTQATDPLPRGGNPEPLGGP
jgi:hypothetical protein